MQHITIHKATRKDLRAFLKLLSGLANFEHLDPPDAAGRRRIIKDIFEKKRGTVLLAFAGKIPVGYALYFFTYSTFLARPTLYLEDIFVLERFRNRRIGYSLFLRCVDEAARNDCGRLEFSVLTWNKNAIDFYEKLGARRLSDWQYYRMTRETIKRLRTISQSPKRNSPHAQAPQGT